MLNTSQRLVNKNSLTWWYVFKTSWRCLQDVFARRLEDVLKTSWRRFGKRSWRCLENVLKTLWQDVLKTSWRRLEEVWTRRIYWSWPRRLEDVFKTSSEDEWLIRIYSSSSRRLEDVLKTSFEDEDERRLRDVFKTSLSRRMFAGKPVCIICSTLYVVIWLLQLLQYVLVYTLPCLTINSWINVSVLSQLFQAYFPNIIC